MHCASAYGRINCPSSSATRKYPKIAKCKSSPKNNWRIRKAVEPYEPYDSVIYEQIFSDWGGEALRLLDLLLDGLASLDHLFLRFLLRLNVNSEYLLQLTAAFLSVDGTHTAIGIHRSADLGS